jgi:hypothetical protein
MAAVAVGVSLRILTEGTLNDPYQSGFLIPSTLDHAEGILVVFCRKSKVPEASTRRLRWVDGAEARFDGMEARIITWAEVRRWRWHANHQLKVAMHVRHVTALRWPAKGSAIK